MVTVNIPSALHSLGDSCFAGCINLENITIPSGITSIGYNTFNNCTSLTTVEIPSGVTSIEEYAFQGCTELTSITCYATTAPTIDYRAFQDIKTGGTLTVPQGSTGYNTWMGTSDYYLGKYNWTKVEQ
jgi:hypothetical protein